MGQSIPALRRICTPLLTLAALLVALVAPASAAPRPATSLGADSFGVSVSATVLGLLPVEVGPLPKVNLYLPPQAAAQRQAVVDLPPVPGLVDRAAVLEATGDGDLAAGKVVASAETAGLSLLGGQIKADVLKAVSTTDCNAAGATAATASAGSRIVGLEIGGQAIELPAAPGELQVRLDLPGLGGLADIRVYDVVPDADGYGWTTRMLHVFLLDPLTKLVNAEIVVSEAHSTATCGEPRSDGLDNPVVISKRAVPGEVAPGREVAYDISVANASAQPCRVFKVTDRLPPGFSYVGTSGTLADVEPSVAGREVTWHNLAGWLVEPGAALTGRLTVRVGAEVAPGTYFNDVIVHSTCGKFEKGQDGPVRVVAPAAPAPAPPAPQAPPPATD
ncbi:MAG TPA: choice-of-anchor P family protein, partial [Egibacteraceae bacterium]|nr:choice-of-anchor P family protein [Egibacteraceae bacterium]